MKDDILTPVHLGRALIKEQDAGIKWLFDNMEGDDTGDNISEKNASYNELTAIYWAWKNFDVLGNPDYIGFMHYRRHFVFMQNGKTYLETTKTEKNKYLEKINYSAQNIEKILNECDFVTNAPYKRTSVYNHYKNAHNISDLEKSLEIIENKFPEYLKDAKEYFNGTKAYFYNMFILPRDIFFLYCNFIFGVLFELEKTVKEKRMYVSERLTGIFFTHLQNNGYKPVCLPTMFVAEKKPPLKAVLAQTKQNIAASKKQGIKKMLYALRPLILYLTPSFLVKAYRNRKAY